MLRTLARLRKRRFLACVFVERVENQIKLLESVPIGCKMGGASGTLAAHYVVIVDHSGSMNAKDCLDDCGGKITRLEAAYDTLLNSYVKETRENAPEGKDIVVSLVTMSTKADVVFERYRLELAEDAISNHAKVAYAHDHGNYLPALAEVERLFSQPIDAEGSHALGVVLLTDGKPSDTVTDPRFVSPALRGYDRIIAQLSWLLRDLEQKVDERFPRFACNLLGIGASRAEFKILDDVNADIKRGSVDHSALDSSLLSSTMTSMATTMMSSVLETSVCAGRAKRTVRKVAQESADAAAAASPRRPAEATDPFDAALPFLTPAQRRNFVENDVTLDCLALLHDEDLDDLLEGDDGAKSSFRMRYPDPAAAERGPSVEEAAEMARREVERLRAEEEAREDARASSLGEKLDVKDPHWLFSEKVTGAMLWNGERLAWRDFDAPRILAKRRKYFSDGAERLAYRGAIVEPDTAVILEDVVFKESKFEEDHVVVKQEDESDDSDDDDEGFLARMTGFGAKHREKRDDKENAHSAYHITFCKAQFEAGQLAVEFNAATERWGRLPRVTFVTSSVYKFTTGVQGELEALYDINDIVSPQANWVHARNSMTQLRNLSCSGGKEPVDKALDWAHVSSVSESDDGASLLVSLRNLDTVLCLARDGSGLRWAISASLPGLVPGVKSTFPSSITAHTTRHTSPISASPTLNASPSTGWAKLISTGWRLGQVVRQSSSGRMRSGPSGFSG